MAQDLRRRRGIEYLDYALQHENLPASPRSYKIATTLAYLVLILLLGTVGFAAMAMTTYQSALLIAKPWIMYTLVPLTLVFALFTRVLSAPQYELAWRRLSLRSRMLAGIFMAVGFLMVGVGIMLFFFGAPLVFPQILLLLGAVTCAATAWLHIKQMQQESAFGAILSSMFLSVLPVLIATWISANLINNLVSSSPKAFFKIILTTEMWASAVVSIISLVAISAVLLKLFFNIHRRKIRWENLSFESRFVAAAMIVLGFLVAGISPILMLADIISPLIAIVATLLGTGTVCITAILHNIEIRRQSNVPPDDVPDAAPLVPSLVGQVFSASQTLAPVSIEIKRFSARAQSPGSIKMFPASRGASSSDSEAASLLSGDNEKLPAAQNI